jgi:hypothetical protein
MAAKFLSGWKKSNSDFDFPSDRDSRITADFQNFSRIFRTAHRVLECLRVLQTLSILGGEPRQRWIG